MPPLLVMDRSAPGSSTGCRSLNELYVRHRSSLPLYRADFGAGPPERRCRPNVFASLRRCGYYAIENPRAFLYRSARNMPLTDTARGRALDVQVALSPHRQPHPSMIWRPNASYHQSNCSQRQSSHSEHEPKRRTVFVMNRIHGLSCAEFHAAPAHLKRPSSGILRRSRACKAAWGML